MGVFRRKSGRGVRRLPALVGGLALVAAAIVLVGFMVSGGQNQAVAALLRDPLAVLAGRSPGLRPGGALLQTKLRREDAGGRRSNDAPDERVLSAVRTRPGEPSLLTSGFAPDDILGTLLPTDAQILNPGASAPGSFVLPGTASVGSGGGGFFGGGGTIGSGPGGGGSAVTPPPPTISPPPPVASVPEPASWLTMLVGFGVVGALLRRFGSPIGAGRRDARRLT